MAYSRVTWEDGSTALSAEHMNNIEEGIGEALAKAQGNTDMWSYIRNLAYPVGSIYMSATLSTADDVEALLGGTWEAWGSGRVPVGVDSAQTEFATAGKTGGAKTVALTTDTLPAHTHGSSEHRHPAPILSNGDMRFVVADAQGSVVNDTINNLSGDSYRIPRQSANYNGFYDAGYTGYATTTTQSAGGGDPHNNLQPYITCYMYKRVS